MTRSWRPIWVRSINHSRLQIHSLLSRLSSLCMIHWCCLRKLSYKIPSYFNSALAWLSIESTKYLHLPFWLFVRGLVTVHAFIYLVKAESLCKYLRQVSPQKAVPKLRVISVGTIASGCSPFATPLKNEGSVLATRCMVKRISSTVSIYALKMF